MKRVMGCCLALLPLAAGAQTVMVIAKQTSAPVQITKAVHGIPEALMEAAFENRGEKAIVAYRVGWTNVEADGRHFDERAWTRCAVAPGGTETVPAQAIPIDWKAQQMIFMIAEVQFADGTYWRAAEVPKSLKLVDR